MAATQTATGAAQRRVLIVEDNPDSRETLEMLLELWGHDVTSAADGGRGVRQALACRPEVAIVDIGLPVLDGYEVARQIRQAYGGSVFLVALTAYGQPEDRQRALQAGFDAHMTKPANPEDLLRLLVA